MIQIAVLMSAWARGRALEYCPRNNLSRAFLGVAASSSVSSPIFRATRTRALATVAGLTIKTRSLVIVDSADRLDCAEDLYTMHS